MIRSENNNKEFKWDSSVSPACTLAVCLQFHCLQQITITPFSSLSVWFSYLYDLCTLTLYQISVSVTPPHTHIQSGGWWSRPLAVFSCSYFHPFWRQLYRLSSRSYHYRPSITAKYTHRQKDCKTHSISPVASSVLSHTCTRHWFIQCPLYWKIVLFNVPQEIRFISGRKEWIEERLLFQNQKTIPLYRIWLFFWNTVMCS